MADGTVDLEDNIPGQYALPASLAASERAVSRIILSTALSGSTLLDGMLDGQISPGTDLPRQVGNLPLDQSDRLLTTLHELRGEREAEMFPGASHLVLTRGAAAALLGKVASEYTLEGPLPLEEQRSADWEESLLELEREGWRALGIAWQSLDGMPAAIDDDLVRGNSLLALLGIREEAHLPPATERSVARRIALQVLFELDCTGHHPERVIRSRLGAQDATRKQGRYVRSLVRMVLEHRAILDETLREYAIDWPPEQLAVVDRNILRMAILEFAITRRAPVAVVINEAIELARLFSGEDAFDFINGVLGAVADELLETADVTPRSRILRDHVESLRAATTTDDLEEFQDAVPEGGEVAVQ